MRILRALPTSVVLVLLLAPASLAKSPPSAFGDGYGQGAAPADLDTDDLAAPDKRSGKRTNAERRVQPPRSRTRKKITLDGSDGGREDREIERDDF